MVSAAIRRVDIPAAAANPGRGYSQFAINVVSVQWARSGCGAPVDDLSEAKVFCDDKP